MKEITEQKNSYKIQFILPDNWTEINPAEQQVIRSIVNHLYQNKKTAATFSKSQIKEKYTQIDVNFPDNPTKYTEFVRTLADKLIKITWKMHKDKKRWVGLLIDSVCHNTKTGNIKVFINPIIAEEFFKLPCDMVKRKKGILNDPQPVPDKTLAERRPAKP